MMIEKGKSIFGDLKQVRFPANCRKHLFLLGPPAVGKLTVGKILSKRINYPLFDNAKTVDVASLLFDYDTNEYRAYRDEMRMLFYNKAMTANIKGLISTCCLRHPSNWCYFDSVEQLLNEHGWNTMYFLLGNTSHNLLTLSSALCKSWIRSFSATSSVISEFPLNLYSLEPITIVPLSVSSIVNL